MRKSKRQKEIDKLKKDDSGMHLCIHDKQPCGLGGHCPDCPLIDKGKGKGN